MAVRCHGKNNAELVRNLSGKAGIVKDPRVVAAMEMVDRGAYCQAHPYEDRPQRIGYNITISAPHMHAHALQELATNLVPGAKVLDVGCGSGYLTACFAELVRGSGGHAYGIDHISGLVEMSETNMRRGNPSYLENGDASLFVADGFQGLPAHAPFDVIHVGAAAPTLPEALVAQLAPGGKLFIPVGPDGGSQEILAVIKQLDGQVTSRSLMGVRYVPLTTPEKQLARR